MDRILLYSRRGQDKQYQIRWYGYPTTRNALLALERLSELFIMATLHRLNNSKAPSWTQAVKKLNTSTEREKQNTRVMSDRNMN